MTKARIIFLAGVAVALVVASMSCDDNVLISNPIAMTPADTAEAQEAALWLSGELFPPDTLVQRMLTSFWQLRHQWGNEIPETDIRFIYPVFPKYLRLKLTPRAADLLREGYYHEWDSLNAAFEVVDVDTSYFAPGYYLHLEFGILFDPRDVAELYEELGGISWASPIGRVGDWPCVYPWVDNGRLTFLVAKAWEDCPSGCGKWHFWYFRSAGTQYDLVGDWAIQGPGDTVLPPWWDEAKVAFYAYHYWWWE